MEHLKKVMTKLVGFIGFQRSDTPFEFGKTCGSCGTSRLKGYNGVPYRHYPECVLHTKYAGQTNIKKGSWWKVW